MEYKRIGRTGLKVSTICLGTMQFGWTADEAASVEIMNRSIELGCNFFDTANIYSTWAEGNAGGVSEQILGNWLSSGAVARHDLVLATKVRGLMAGNPEGETTNPNAQGLSRTHIMHEVEQSLRRLQTDYIDLYQVHWPDDETPLDETLSALTDLVQSGKVRYIGCSNHPAWLLAKSLWVSDVNNLARYDCLQPKYSLVNRAEFERGLQPLCLDQGVGVIPYSPLGGGFLTGKYRRDSALPESARAGSVQTQYMNEAGFALIDKMDEIAQAQDATVAQVAIAWVLANPAVTSAIIGANTIAQLEDTMKGADVVLSAENKQALDTLTTWT